MDRPIPITPPKVIPNVTRLVDAVYEHSWLYRSYIHGDPHWRAVAEVGLKLIPDTRDADPMVVFLFALFHDSMRENEDADPEHGRRGGELARMLHEEGRFFQLQEWRLELLVRACDEHVETRLTNDPTLAVCFDADRLNLWRIGKVPQERYLSSDAALDDALHRWTRELHGHARDWDELLHDYEA